MPKMKPTLEGAQKPPPTSVEPPIPEAGRGSPVDTGEVLTLMGMASPEAAAAGEGASIPISDKAADELLCSPTADTGRGYLSGQLPLIGAMYGWQQPNTYWYSSLENSSEQ